MSRPQELSPDSLSGTFAKASARSARLEQQLLLQPQAHAVLTGDRPTGPLHLGHYFGTLENRVRLQELGVDLMVLIADYQTIIDRDSPRSLPRDVEALLAEGSERAGEIAERTLQEVRSRMHTSYSHGVLNR